MLKSVTFRSTLAAVACAISFSVFAMAKGPAQLDIPAGNLVPALEALEKQVAIELVFQPEQLKSFHTKGVKGVFEPRDAVRLLLKGTPLELRTDPTGAMVIVAAHAAANRAQAQTASGGAKEDDSRSSLQLAQATSGQTSGSTYVGGQQASNFQQSSASATLAEVTVTAQKREERLSDVPIPISVINANMLTENNQTLFGDYYSSVPGLTLESSSQSQVALSIRGIAPNATNLPTTSVILDDVPFSDSTNEVAPIPDLDPGDLDHVEVLRGPQGTLYGSSSMGGLIKFVTVDPSTDGYSGRIQAGTSDVYNGAEPGYNIRASANIPLNSTLAIRVSGFDRQDPGYIDNPIFFRTGVNETDTYGGRIAALWHATDDISLKLTAMYQENNAKGVSEIDVVPGLGDLQQNYLPETGGSKGIVQLYTATLRAKIGTAELTAISGYSINQVNDWIDFSQVVGVVSQLLFGPTVSGAPFNFVDKIDKASEELRVSMPLGTRFDWLVGAFYTHERDQPDNIIYAASPLTGQIVGLDLNQILPSHYTEYALFTDLTYHVTNGFDIQIGGRQSHLSTITDPQTDIGSAFDEFFFQRPSPFITPGGQATFSPFTYLFTPSFKIFPDVMIYARVASGFRTGGYNSQAIAFNFPSNFGPDKTQNYEFGLKGDFLEHKLSIDASFYYIDWKNLQTPVVVLESNGITEGYTANVGTAKSEGVEFAVTTRPLTGLALSAWFDYDDAVETKSPANSTIYAPPGSRLPLSARESANLSVEQTFPLSSTVAGYAGGMVSYLGDRLGGFAPVGLTRQEYPAYTKTDLHAGLKVDSWTINLFVNNLTDKRALLGGGKDEGNGPPYAFQIITPRTIGVNVVKTF